MSEMIDKYDESIMRLNARIVELEKALSDAVDLANIRVETRKGLNDNDPDIDYVYCDSCGTPFMGSLAAELKRMEEKVNEQMTNPTNDPLREERIALAKTWTPEVLFQQWDNADRAVIALTECLGNERNRGKHN